MHPENRHELEAVRARCGMDNVAYFAELRILNHVTCLAHCIWLNDDEVDLMARHQARVLHCPSSNLKARTRASPRSRAISPAASRYRWVPMVHRATTRSVCSRRCGLPRSSKPVHGPNGRCPRWRCSVWPPWVVQRRSVSPAKQGALNGERRRISSCWTSHATGMRPRPLHRRISQGTSSIPPDRRTLPAVMVDRELALPGRRAPHPGSPPDGG
ncbi:MAG: amidohydrolase family protein [Ignavibacteriales bacterium]|nr:amidohydrolase family protein [Ignavibacteriales bacterium]